MRRWLRRLEAPGATPNDWVLDTTLAALGIILCLMSYLVVFSMSAPVTSAMIIRITGITGFLTFAGLILRRHYPDLLMLSTAFFLTLTMVLVNPITPAVVVLPIAVYTVARWVPGRRAHYAVWFAAIYSVVVPVRAFVFNDMWEWVAPRKVPMVLDDSTRIAAVMVFVVIIGSVATAFSVGRRGLAEQQVREQQRQAEADRQRTQLAELEARQREIETQTRNSIAQELHDIVAHSISIMIVQAEGGQSMAKKSPEKALATLSAISDIGREALGEMRHILDVLRSGANDTGAAYDPAPTFADIPELVERTGATLTYQGTPTPINQALGLTTYRIIQEALTNVLKHAGPGAEPKVTIAWTATEFIVVVTNRSTGRLPNPTKSGYGLMGMTERVTSHQGTLATGPTPEGGFRICARFPLRATRLP
jgi:signal transduction histidine kinase